MPAHTDPTAAGVYDDRVVHIQGNDRRPANGGRSDKQCPGLIPLEMIRPTLLPGMKQGHRFSSQRILGMGSAAFELVATTASKAEVFKGGLTALGLGKNVVYGHWLAGVRLGRMIVGTVAIVSLKQAIVQIGRQVTRRLQLVGGGNLMAAPLQQTRRMRLAQHISVLVGTKLGQFVSLAGREGLVGVLVE